MVGWLNSYSVLVFLFSSACFSDDPGVEISTRVNPYTQAEKAKMSQEKWLTRGVSQVPSLILSLLLTPAESTFTEFVPWQVHHVHQGSPIITLLRPIPPCWPMALNLRSKSLTFMVDLCWVQSEACGALCDQVQSRWHWELLSKTLITVFGFCCFYHQLTW